MHLSLFGIGATVPWSPLTIKVSSNSAYPLVLDEELHIGAVAGTVQVTRASNWPSIRGDFGKLGVGKQIIFFLK